MTYNKSWPNIMNTLMNLLVFTHIKVHIDMIPYMELVHHQAYPAPCAHEKTLKKEPHHMFDIGILEELGVSE